MFKYLLVVAAASFAAGVAAQEPLEKPLQASVELGAIATTGNTETLSVQGKAEIRQEFENWLNEYTVSVLFKEDEVTQQDGTTNTERTAERYYFSAKSAYKLGENSNLFLFGSHTEDKFAAFREYSTVSLGYGTRLVETPTTYLDVEIGPGYFRGERVIDEETETIEVEKGAIARGALEFQWQITDSATFEQDLSVESGSANTRTISETSIATQISGSLQMKIGYTVIHNSTVAPDIEATDTTTSINLVYSL